MVQQATAPSVKILPLGTYQIQQPVSALHLAGLARSAFTESGFLPPPFIYTIKAARQMLAVLRGEAVVEPALAKFCAALAPGGEGRPQDILPGCDLAIIEPNYAVDIVAEGLILSRELIKRHLTDPLSVLGPEIKKLCFTWKTKGLLAHNEEARRFAADALLRSVPDDIANFEAIRWVLRHARGLPSDDRLLTTDLNALRETLGMPCALSLCTYRYLEDGSPMSEPAGFRVSIKRLGKRLDLPVLDLSGLVRRVGVANALRPDQRRFRADFLPLAGRSILYFLDRNHERFGIPKSRLALKSNPGSKLERFRRLEAAREAERMGRLSAALKHYRAMIEANAEDTGALKGRRRVAQRLGLHAEAYEAAEILARREPHIPAHAAVLAKYARLAKLKRPGLVVQLAEAS